MFEGDELYFNYQGARWVIRFANETEAYRHLYAVNGMGPRRLSEHRMISAAQAAITNAENQGAVIPFKCRTYLLTVERADR